MLRFGVTVQKHVAILQMVKQIFTYFLLIALDVSRENISTQNMLQFPCTMLCSNVREIGLSNKKMTSSLLRNLKRSTLRGGVGKRCSKNSICPQHMVCTGL